MNPDRAYCAVCGAELFGDLPSTDPAVCSEYCAGRHDEKHHPGQWRPQLGVRGPELGVRVYRQARKS